MAKLIVKVAEPSAGEARIGPDPITVVLPALSALGAISSIAVLGWIGRDHGTASRRGRRNLNAILRDMERDCVDLQDAFRRIARGLPALASGGGGTSLPMKFGVHGLAVPEHSYPLYQSLLSTIAALFLRASQDSFELIGAIEDGSIEPSDDVFEALGEAQERLNAILVTRASLKVAIETGYDIAVRLSGVFEQLRAQHAA